MSELGRACLLEIGCNSRWWARGRHILLCLICLRLIIVNGFDRLGMNVNGKNMDKPCG